MSDVYPARLYVAVHEGNPGDVAFYRRCCADAGSVLELGCGDARVLAELAEPGRTLLGVDIDDELLALAHERRARMAPELAAGLELRRGDMGAAVDDDGEGEAGAIEPDRRFDRIIIPYGGLYCLLDEAAVASLLTTVVRHLAADGLLIFDVWAADGFHAEADPEDLDPSWLERVKTIEVDEVVYEVLERSRWDKPAQRLDVTYLHVAVGAEEAVEGELPQRYLLLDQLRELLRDAGLDIRSLHGGFEGQPYDPDESMLLVVVAGRGS
ncbi:MAG: class I SAM-dependent methyltransferase [Myxococcales bacterium]|nr:class I SAM-dependent methyltransferase [Myxococcales bacterium]